MPVRASRIAISVQSLCFAALILILAPAAQASKARLKGLGQAVDGSFFILDNRDIFLNPATVSDLSSSANFEWGGQTTATPNAEGGGVYKASTMNYAFQLGRLGDSTQAMIASNTTGVNSGTLFYPQNSLDAIIGAGVSGLKWGAGVHYARSLSNTGAVVNFPQQKARELSISGGVELAQFSTYAKFDIQQDSDTDLANGGSIDYTGKPGGTAGVKFSFDADDAVDLIYIRRLYSFSNGSSTSGDFNQQLIRANFFRQLLKTEKTMLFFTAGLSYDTSSISYQALGVNGAKLSLFTSPLVIGIEHRAMQWLTLRASASQAVLIDQDKRVDGTNDYDRANLENTTVAAGLTVYASDFQIDGTFEGADSTTGNAGKLNATALATNVSVAYNF